MHRLSRQNAGSRVFSAYLLSYLLIVMPFAQIAAAARQRSEIRTQKPDASRVPTSSATNAAAENVFVNGPIAEPAPEPVVGITATMTGTLTTDADSDTKADPAVDTITYTTTITNNSGGDLTGLQFTDTVDPHTTIISGSAVAAGDDAYNTIGNVNINVPVAQGVLANDFNPNTGNNTGMTVMSYGASTGLEQTSVGSSTPTAQGGTVTVQSNGSFTYDPKISFTGTDTFKYAANQGGTKAIATVRITISGIIWFIKNDAAACTTISTPCGTLAHPFSTLAAFQAVNDGNAGPPQHPKANDNIFIYTGVGNYTGGVALLNGEKLIGQGATASIETITGLSTPSGNTVLPTTSGTNPVLTTGSLTDNIRLGTGNSNLIRGFTVGDSGSSTGDSSDISGTNIGTLTVSEVTLNGKGRTLNINGGALSGSFTSVASTGSTGQGLTLAGVTGSINMSSTTISGFTTGCISVSTTTANVNFGNTSCTSGGSEGVNLTNNSAGTRTFGTLTVSGISATAFIHSTGGGDVNITGAANLTTAGNAISVNAPANGDLIDFQAATSATTTGNQVTGINWAGAAGATMQFNSLTIQRNNGIALNANTGGTITVTNGTGSITNTTAGGPAIVANGIALNANFSQINSSASAPTGTSAVSLTNVSGTSNFGTGALSGASGATFLVSGGTASVTYSGNITQATAAQPMVSIAGGHNTGTITFQTGTLSATNGTGLQFDNADGTYNFNGTNTLNGGDAGIDILNGSAGTFSFSSNTSITNPTGTCFVANGSTAGVTYSGNITKSTSPSSGLLVDITNESSGTITFQTGTLSSTNNSGTGIQLSNADGTVNFNGTTTLNGGDAGIDILNGSSGTFSFSSSSTITSPSGTAFNVGSSPGNPIVTYSGSITQNTNNQRVVNIDGTTGNTITFQTGTITGGASSTGININNANGNVTFSNGMTMGTSGSRMTSQAVTITNGSSSATYSLGTVSIFTNNVSGIVATNFDGTLNSASGTVDSSGATAINIDGPAGLTTLGMTLTRVDSAGGTADGISLQDTNGSFTVNGDGTNVVVGGNGSGGTISNKSGADSNNTQGIGVFMSNVSGVTLRRMTINGTNQNFGIFGSSVTNFTLEYSTVTGTNGTNTGLDEGSVQFRNLLGSAAITSCSIDGGLEDNLNVVNTSGTLNRLVISGSTFGFNNTTNGNNNILMESQNAGTTLNFTLKSSTLKGARADFINFANNSGSTGDSLIGGPTAADGNIFNNLDAGFVHPGAAAGGNRIVFGGVGNSTVDVRNNTIKGSKGEAIRIRSTAVGAVVGTVNARVRNNTIGVAATANSGSSEGAGIFLFNDGGSHAVVSVTDNVIRQTNNHGISIQMGDEINNGATYNVTVTGNSFSNPGTINTDFSAISLSHGTVLATDDFTSCVDIGGAGALKNTTTNYKSGVVYPNNAEIRVRQRQNTTVRMPGYSGSNIDTAAVENFIFNRNTMANPGDTNGGGGADGAPDSSAASVQNASSPSTHGFQNTAGGAPCTQPSFAMLNPLQKSREYFAGILDKHWKVSNDPNLAFLNYEGGYGSPLQDIQINPEIATRLAQATVGGQSALRLALATVNAEITHPTINAETTAQLAQATVRAESHSLKQEEAQSRPGMVESALSHLGSTFESLIVPSAYAESGSQRSEVTKQAAAGSKQEVGRSFNHVRNTKRETRNSKLATAMTPVVACSPAGINGGGTAICVDIPTIHDGQSIAISFQVTVNNPPNLTGVPPGTPQVSNFGSVTGPASGTTNTVNTPVDLFNSTNTLVSNNNPANQGDSITFTATVAISGSQSPLPPSPVTPTGTVTFKSDGVAIGGCSNVALNGSAQAQCTTSALTPPSHNITAEYSGDGNYDPSTSNTVSQTVVSCGATPVVTKIADTNDGVCDGDCSLREAIATACNGATITFNTAGVFATPQTITLTSELTIGTNVKIDGADTLAQQVTINGGNSTFRLFKIQSGKTATIRDLKLTGGNIAGNGGAIWNDHGTLTLINLDLTANNASGNGGGVYNDATAGGSATLNVINSTLSNNNAGAGGGVYNNASGGGTATLNLTNSTVSGNHATGSGGGVYTDGTGGTANVTINDCTITNDVADSDNDASGTGGGIALVASTVVLHNTIVAGNINENGVTDSADDISGTVDASSSFNLIGDTATSGGLTNGTNGNKVGNAGSGTIDITTVLDTTLANNGGITPTHKLVTGSPAREAGNNADLPADTFDLDGDANTAEPLPVDQRGIGFPRIADSADADTTATVDIGAFELHPSIEDITDKTTNEDTALPGFSFNIGDGTGALITSVTASSSNTTLVPNDVGHLSVTGSGSTRTLNITPATDANGTTTITVTVTATNGQTAQDTFTLTVNAVNDAPTFQIQNNPPAVNEDAGAQTVNNFATNFQPGPVTATDEAGQTLVGYALSLTGSTGGLTFSSGPAISNAGTLTYTPTANASGTATYNVVATDSGSGTPPNVNQSAPVSFTITVNAQNDPPTLTTNAGLTVTNGGTGTIDNTKLQVDDVDNTAAQLVFTIGTAPVNGILKKGAVVLSSGNTFTQADINNNLITYQHTNLATFSDSFTFTVSDGAGGTIGLTTFNIVTGCANNITVTSNADTGNGTLRQAISVVCAGGTITFDMSKVVSPITLTTGELVVDKNLTIQGPTTTGLTISGNLNSRVFNVNPGMTALISSLTISNGRAAFGGGVYNQGTLSIIGTTINGNATADGVDGSGASNGTNGGNGGGLYNSGTLKLINSTITGNQTGNGGNATGTGLGGNGGNGGGLYSSGTLLLVNDTFSENRTGHNGLNVNGDDTNVDLGTVGQGGGLYSVTATAVLNNTVLAGNLTSSFFHSDNMGGTTIEDLNNDAAGTVDSSSAFNLIGAIGALSGITGGTNGNQVGAADAPLNPLFGPLTNNGGPTVTYLPQQFSPVIDAGSNALATDQNSNPLTTDQRGTGFPRILNGTVDIGSVETVPPPPPPPSADVGVSKFVDVDESLADRNLVYTITLLNAGPDAAANVTLSDALPGNLTFVSLSAPGGWSCSTPAVGANGTISCSNPSFGFNPGVVFTLTAHIPSGTAAGTFYHNVANVSSATDDPNDINNSYPADTTVASCLTNPFVITNANSGAGSLRQAIIDACDGSIINFNMASVVSPITLASELVINKNLTIEGPGANLLTIAGNNNIRLINVVTPTSLTLDGLSFTGGGPQGGTNASVVEFNNAGTLTLRNSEFFANSGTNLVYSNLSTGITIDGSTFRANTPSSVVKSDRTPLRVVNSTFSGNPGTAIYNSAIGSTVTNATFVNNATGIWSDSIVCGGCAANVGLANTLLSNNGNVNLRKTGIATLTSDGHNLIDDGTASAFTVADPTNVIIPAGTALIAPLANYGGPTQTHALLPGSPAINTGGNAAVTDPPFSGPPFYDQRGAGFDRTVNGTVDIGAFESHGFTVAATSGTPQSAVILTAFGSPLVTTVTSGFSEPVSGGQVTFTAPASGASATFTGGVTAIKASINASGQATATATANGTAGGPYNVTATGVGITGTANFSLTNLKAATVTTVTSSVNPSNFGQSVTFTATITSGAGTPTGTVQFKDGMTNLGGPVVLNVNGVATLTTSTLTVGTHPITADYGGDGNFAISTGTLAGGQVVNQPTLSINDVSTTEGQAGTKVLNFTVTLSVASNQTVTVNFATANGTATAGSDYVATSGGLTFNPGDTTKTIPVTINGDINFEPDETFTVNLSAPSNATISKASGTGTIQNDDAQGGFFSFSDTNYFVNEIFGFVTVTINRTNDVSQPANVDYATDDTGASIDCSALNTGLASQRCDYTSLFGTLKFAANETQKTIDIPINLDGYFEGTENFTVKLSNPTNGAVLTTPFNAVVSIFDAPAAALSLPNPIDGTDDFVRQQYHDFLNRDADPSGLAFWKNNIDKCNDPAQRPPGQTLAACIEVQRITTSAAFFLSIEFKQTGGLVRDFYVASLNRPLTNNMPDFVEFMRDTQAIQKGVVVGQGNWQQTLDANRLAFMNEFVMRPEFVGLYPTTDTPTQYVNMIYQHAALAPTPGDRAATIAEFGAAPTASDPAARARALLRITQDPAFQAREVLRAFVHMEYLGYLRRNPNDTPDNNFDGYNFWLNKLILFNGDFLQSEMVKAFLSSLEYRKRFGP